MPPKFLHWDANIWISNTLLTLLLSSYIVIIYVTVVIVGMLPFGGLHEPFPSVITRVPRWLDLIGFVLIGITFSPVTRWLRIHINDLVYKQNEDPYILTSLVTKQLQTMTYPQLTLPTLTEIIAHTLQLPYVIIETSYAGPSLRFTFGNQTAGNELNQFPITYLDNPIGMMLVSTRTAAQPLAERDRALLKEVAQQLGIALRAAQLTTELQASREHLVIAREEERRRIRNDLHDGLAPTLSAVQMQLGAIKKLLNQDLPQAETMINEVRDDMRLATIEIRQIVYDLRPPMLDELGLVGAIKSFRFPSSEIRFEVNAPHTLPPLSAAVEVAIYRIASEAVHNVVKHAQATLCIISIEVLEDRLRLTVTDDGKGFPEKLQAGIGLRSMKERAEEVGGTFSIQTGIGSGICLMASLPILDDLSENEQGNNGQNIDPDRR